LPSPPAIAVVDDDAALRDSLCELIRAFSMSCRTFDRADAFLSAYVPGQFDCLITDLRMPGMGGLELQRAVKALDASLPVIVVTSAVDAQSRSRALEQGVFAYLTKPVSGDVLLRQLTAALDRQIPSGETENG